MFGCGLLTVPGALVVAAVSAHPERLRMFGMAKSTKISSKMEDISGQMVIQDDVIAAC